MPTQDDPNSECIVVVSTVPDRAIAETIARSLVSDGLAACVSIGAPATSFYRWKGELEQAEEIPLLIKTRRCRYAALEAALRALHPYELPEILALPVVAGLPDYLHWVKACTDAES